MPVILYLWSFNRTKSLILKNLILLLSAILCGTSCTEQKKADENSSLFVQTDGIRFSLGGRDLYFLGTNYWYGPALALMQDTVRGIGRLRMELDFLKAHGMTNLRICAAVEGSGIIQDVPRIEPVFQSAPGVFEVRNLRGLDIVLDEMARRDMKAVLFFSNNWEWSGGFLQYLSWNKIVDDSSFVRKMDWDRLRDEVSRFYSCAPCKQQYEAQVRAIIGHINSINGRKYSEDPTVFAWQLANEPRPMRPAAIDAYKDWISQIAAVIKSLDTNHLLAIGVEGEIGTENIDVFKTIHSDKNIDYATIHIWPRNWAWYTDLDDEEQQTKVLRMTTDYIGKHADVMKAIGKPLVLEEFGYPRDGNSFEPAATTRARDRFYDNILQYWHRSKSQRDVLAGCNFWAFGGTARPIPGQKFRKPGDDFTGDPPMEEQGLYSVFDSDTSTWKVIEKYNGIK